MPLALVLVAALVVPVSLTPGTFGFHHWPKATTERVAISPLPVAPRQIAVAPEQRAKPRRGAGATVAVSHNATQPSGRILAVAPVSGPVRHGVTTAPAPVPSPTDPGRGGHHAPVPGHTPAGSPPQPAPAPAPTQPAADPQPATTVVAAVTVDPAALRGAPVNPPAPQVSVSASASTDEGHGNQDGGDNDNGDGNGRQHAPGQHDGGRHGLRIGLDVRVGGE